MLVKKFSSKMEHTLVLSTITDVTLGLMRSEERYPLHDTLSAINGKNTEWRSY